jgi:hypothetical protein
MNLRLPGFPNSLPLAALLMAGLLAARAAALPLPGADENPKSQPGAPRPAAASLSVSFPDLVNVAQDVAFADLNRNGRMELVTIGAFDDSLAVLFHPEQPPACGEAIRTWPVGINPGSGNDLPRALVTADFDADRRTDIAVVCSGYPPESAVPEAWKRSSVSIYLGRPGGELVLSQHIELPKPAGRIAYAASMVSGDFNGDGIEDLVVGNRRANSFTLLLGDGYGRFHPLTPVMLPDANEGPRALDTLIGGGQRRLLILTERRLYEAIPSRIAPSGWTIALPVMLPRGSDSEFTSLARGDFDGDGKWDLAVGDAAGGILLLRSWGEFSPSNPPMTFYRPEMGEVISLSAGDWRGIGRDDLVSADHLSGRLMIWDVLETVEVGRYQPCRRPRKVVLHDWTRRGLPDIFAADEAEALGFASPDIVRIGNPTPIPNGLSVRGPDPTLPVRIAPDLGLLQGLETAPAQNQFWVAAPDRAMVFLLQAPPEGIVQRTPTILSRWNPGGTAACWYPTDMALDREREELIVTASGDNRLWRFGLDGRPRGDITPSNFYPGSSGWWGVAVRAPRSAGAITWFLAAPDRRTIVEITREGILRRIIPTGEFPPMDLAYDAAQDQLIATHPRLAGMRRYSLGPTPSLADQPDPVTEPKIPPVPLNSTLTTPLAEFGVRRTDGVAAFFIPTTQQRTVYLLTDGHIAEWIEGYANLRQLEPRLLLLEGNPASLAVDRSSGSLLFSIGRPFPAMAEFAPNATSGILWPLSNAAQPGEPFDPGPLTVDPQTHEVYMANRNGDRLLRLGWPSRVVVDSIRLQETMTPDFKIPPAVGLLREPRTGMLHMVFSSTMMPVSPSESGIPPSFPPHRFSLSHPVTSAAEDAGGRMNFFSASDGWLITRPPAATAIPLLTSIFPFLKPGQTPFSVIPSVSENRIFFSLDGQVDSLALLLGDLSAARASWQAYE